MSFQWESDIDTVLYTTFMSGDKDNGGYLDE